MSTAFADTFYYLALLNRDDRRHEQAVRFSRGLPARSVTTEWVITEVADAFAGLSQRSNFLALLRQLRTNPHVTIVPASHSLFERGLTLYARRLDKDWSLTDCISFVVMKERGISEALTGDHPFEQAGFKILLK
jgi:predicted nucleic acid-binding protein